LFVVDLKVGEERAESRHEPVGSSSCDLRLLDSLRMQEEEELHMLASLQREQEEEEDGGGATGLSASQIHQCNVSISTSSDEPSTWTHIPMVSHVPQRWGTSEDVLLRMFAIDVGG
jgi:hypothetical protein